MVMIPILDGKDWGTERLSPLSEVMQAVSIQSPVLKYLSSYNSFESKWNLYSDTLSLLKGLNQRVWMALRLLYFLVQDCNYHGTTTREKQTTRFCTLSLGRQQNHHFPLWYILLLFKNILLFRVSPKVADGFSRHPVRGTRSYHFKTASSWMWINELKPHAIASSNFPSFHEPS